MKQLNTAEDPDKEQLIKRFCRLFFMALAIIGSVIYYYSGDTMLGGFGLSSSLFSMVSFFHFNKIIDRTSDTIETKMTWFFLAMVFIGLLLILANKAQDGPHFYFGIAGAMTFLGGLGYCLELFLVWLANVR